MLWGIADHHKFWGAADMCTVQHDKRESSFRFSSIQTRPNDVKSVVGMSWGMVEIWIHFGGSMQVLLAPEHMHAGFTCTGTHACSIKTSFRFSSIGALQITRSFCRPTSDFGE